MREAYAALCTEVLAGTLALEHCALRLAGLESPHAYYGLVRASIAEGVEHLPMKWLSGRIDTEAWCASDLYGELILHQTLLRTRAADDALLAVYRAIEPRLPLASDDIEAGVRERLGDPAD